MGQFFSEETIANIMQAVDITDVIGEKVQLKKQGKDYIGLCPFHEEKTPSFSVSPDKQLYYCFGCQAGGNMITFVMETEGLSFHEAVVKLGKQAGIDISLPDRFHEKEKDSKTTRFIEAHELAARFFHHLLMNTEQGKVAYDYLMDRGISPDVMKQFQLGYAPKEQTVLKELLEKRQFDAQEMEECGLLRRVEATWELEDRFRHRIMFPIWNIDGKVVGFGGRIITDGQPKYVNTPETPIFKKNELLYGFHLARPFVRKKNRVILFEGYVDVLSSHLADLPYAIATLGTSLTKRQAQIIRRNTERITICYDGDRAGEDATLKAANLLQQEGLQVEIAILPEEEDPDQYIRTYGKERFQKEIIEAAVPLIVFKMHLFKKEKNLNDEGEKLQYVEEVLHEIASLSTSVEQDIYVRHLSEETSVSLEALKQELERKIRANHRTSHSTKTKNKRWQIAPLKRQSLRPAYQNAERMLLAHMMHDKSVAEEVKQKIGGHFPTEEYMAIAAYLYAFYAEGHPADPNAFLLYMEDKDLVQTATELLMLDRTNELSENELVDYMDQINNHLNWVKIEQIEQKLKEAERRQDLEEAVQLATQLIDMKKATQK